MVDRSEITEYLLGELDELDRARLERELLEDASLRAEVDSLRPVVARLDSLAGPVWEHVGEHHAGTAAAGAPARRSRRRGAALRPLAGALVAFAAAAAVLAILLAPGGSGTRSHTVVLSALAGAPPGSRATATITGSQRVQVSVEHLRPTDGRHYYELWLMTDTTHLVPVASFRVDGDGDAHLSLPLPASPAAYRYLNISLQRAGVGSSISSLSVLRGPTAA